MDTKDYITLAISIVALGLSLISAVISTRGQSTQLRTTIRDQLASIVQEIITTLAENRLLQSEDVAKRDALFYSKSSAFSFKLSSLARQAAALIEYDEEIGFDVEFAAIAQAFDVVSDIPRAEGFWQNAVGASPSDYYRIINRRGYADFLFRQGRHSDGRTQYEEALAILDNDSDFNKWTNGYTYQMWFISEFWNIPLAHSRSEECFREAQRLYLLIDSALIKANSMQSLLAAQFALPSAEAPLPASNMTVPRPEPNAEQIVGPERG